jgi:arylsulfatase A-like enzyme
MGHGYLLYNELVHVPLLLHAPGRIAPQAVPYPVSTLEIFPTIVDLLAMPQLGSRLDGASFLPLVEGKEAGWGDRMPLFEVEYHTRKVGVVHWPWKVIFDQDSSVWEVYNIETDQAEAKELEASTRDVPAVVEAKERITRYISQESVVAPKATLPPIEYSDKEIEKLKTLGYMM